MAGMPRWELTILATTQAMEPLEQWQALGAKTIATEGNSFWADGWIGGMMPITGNPWPSRHLRRTLKGAPNKNGTPDGASGVKWSLHLRGHMALFSHPCRGHPPNLVLLVVQTHACAGCRMH